MSRLRNQDGFTLMEAVTAMTVGFVIMAATLTLLDSTVRLNTGVLAKTDAMQRGRIAMDNLTQQLRAQVCLDFSNPAILTESTEDSVTFYSDYSEEGKTPVKRRITFNEAKGTIVSQAFESPSLKVPPPADSYAETPSSSNLLLEGVSRQKDEAGGDTVPFLRYYAYEKDGAGTWRATEELEPPFDDEPEDAAKVARIARVEIAFFVQPTGTKQMSKGVNLSDEVMARHADPNLSVPDPNCV
jgi:hypothetical protein